MKNIYKHFLPAKVLFLIELSLGISLLSFLLYLFKQEIYPDIWTFAGPLLSAALIIAGLTGSKITEINVYTSQQYIEICKESLFSTKSIKINFKQLRSELKIANGKKNSLIPKLRLIIFDKEEEIEELTSNFLGFNNEKLGKLYAEIKKIREEK